MQCKSCGSYNPDDSTFCSSCGTRLEKANKHVIDYITAECPKCGATLSIEENRLSAFCNYCGAKILIHRDNEKIYHFIDEADIKRAETESKNAETERVIKIKHLEEEVREKRKEKFVYLMTLILCIFFLIVGEIFAMKIGHSAMTTALFILGFFGAMFSIFSLLGWDNNKN